MIVRIFNELLLGLEGHASELSLELAQDLLPALCRLVDSEYEDYLLCGLTTVGTLLKAVGPTMRDVAELMRLGQFRNVRR